MPRRAADRGVAAAVLAAAALTVLAAGCGGRILAAGTVPFPSEKPVFIDGDGRPLRSLPASNEPLKIAVLDFPWCPPCADAWKAVRSAAAAFPPGSLRVYRILFDRERRFARDGVSEAPPFRPVAPAAPADAASPGFAVTTLTAVPDAFRREYEVAQAPVILLLSGSGTVIRRWTGYSASLSASIAAEIRRVEGAMEDQDASVSPPP